MAKSFVDWMSKNLSLYPVYCLVQKFIRSPKSEFESILCRNDNFIISKKIIVKNNDFPNINTHNHYLNLCTCASFQTYTISHITFWFFFSSGTGLIWCRFCLFEFISCLFGSISSTASWIHNRASILELSNTNKWTSEGFTA